MIRITQSHINLHLKIKFKVCIVFQKEFIEVRRFFPSKQRFLDTKDAPSFIVKFCSTVKELPLHNDFQFDHMVLRPTLF